MLGQYPRMVLISCLLSLFTRVSFGQTPGQPSAAPALKFEPPRSAAASLRALRVPDGFTVELVAAEPLVIDPVAIDWGPDGKLWVVEMADYPLGLDGKMKAGGRVRYLEDSKGNGAYDKSTLFLDGVNFPNGVIPWRSGVVISAAPEIFYAECTRPDGKADMRQTLYAGFHEGNPQLRINSLRWGLDGWLHCANGWSGGVVRSVKTGASVDLRGRDLRIRPDEGLLDPQAGVSQFGRNRDDWGSWFGCDNSHPLFHYVLEDQYMRRNPYSAAPDAKRQVVLPANPKIYPLSPIQKRYHSFNQAGCFTSACASMIYRDDRLFPLGPICHAFTCEPVHNLMHHELLSDDGVSFHARRADGEKESEFLASTDPWFRPVMVRTGPDGALWVVDMYRCVIEHPEFLPPAGKKELAPFYRLGDDKGRIYRIYPTGQKPRAIPRLDKLTPVQLVAALDSPSGWQRDTAQAMLLWKKDPAAVEPLKQLIAAIKNPRARLHALYALDSLEALDAETLVQALGAAHPGIRRHALRLAEPRGKEEPRLVDAAVKLADDPDPKVKLQLACSLGAWNNARAGQALARLAVANDGDPYFLAAVMSSVSKDNLDMMLQNVLRTPKRETHGALLERLLATAAGLGKDNTVLNAFADCIQPANDAYAAWQMSLAAATLDALKQRGQRLEDLAAAAGKPGEPALERLELLRAFARRSALDEKANEADRMQAVRLMGRRPQERKQDVAALLQLLVPQTPAGLQSAVVAHLGKDKDPDLADALLAGWKSFGPSLRSQVLGLLLSRGEWLAVLLDRLDKGQVLPADIDAASAQRLLQHKDAKVKARAKKLLAFAANVDRQKVLSEYRPVLTMKGVLERGALVFQKNCAACHKIGAVGTEVGPNLTALNDKSPQALLNSILDPSSAVDARFINYYVVTKDGRSFSGILATETGNSVTLIDKDGKPQVILRSQLEELQSTGTSLMPDGFETTLSHQDLADLIAFIAGNGPAVQR